MTTRTRSRCIRLYLVGAIVFRVMLSQGFALSGQAGPQDRIAGPIVDSDAVTLAGNTHPLALPEFDQGVISGETRLERLVLLLQPDSAQQSALDALVEAQQQPSSASYRQWLSPEEFGSRFGASPGDLARITAWLTGRGFTVESVAAGRRLVIFSGTAGQVADAFHTEIHRYQVNGATHIANSDDPQIPRALASVVAGIVSLHDFRRASAISSIRPVQPSERSEPENTQGSAHYLFPADFATIYDLNPQYAAGRRGSGVSIAIAGRSNISLGDVSSFRGYAGLPANQPSVILDGKNPGLVSVDQDESTLDVEWSGGVAPGAAIKFVAAASTATTDGVDLAAQYIVNNKTAPVMSVSYGDCESEMGTGEMAFYNSLWEQAASEGISVFVASGDSGAAGCDAGSASKGTKAAVNGMCSSAYATCVGGTEFDEGADNYWAATNGAGGGSALSYIPEKVWNESADDDGSGLWSSGGGISEAYLQPVWQKGIQGANSNGMRAVPDVALTAAGHDGYLICENGAWFAVSGTSAAAPSFAGIMSLVVEKQSGIAQGNSNPSLYGLLDASENPFHATPDGNNTVPGVSGFTASGVSYNLATGLGSVDANLLVNNWPSPVSKQQGFTLKPSVTSEALLAGRSVSFTIAIAGTGGFAGEVTLAARTPSGFTVTFSPASVKAGAASTATVTVERGVPAGTANFVITGTSGSISGTATIALTVEAVPTLSIMTSAAKVTLNRGQSAGLLVVTTTGGGYSGQISLTVSGVPAGVTATWSSGDLTSSGAGVWVASLILTASESAPLTPANLKITASGDGLEAQSPCNLEVSQGLNFGFFPDRPEPMQATPVDRTLPALFR